MRADWGSRTNSFLWQGSTLRRLGRGVLAMGDSELRNPSEAAAKYLPPGTLIRWTRLDEKTVKYEQVPPTAAQHDLGI